MTVGMKDALHHVVADQHHDVRVPYQAIDPGVRQARMHPLEPAPPGHLHHRFGPERRVAFAASLRAHAGRPALIDHVGDTLTYDELADRVDDLVERLGPAPRLVLVEASNRVDPIVAYLACLTAGHPVVMASDTTAGRAAAIVRTFDPDVVLGDDDGRWRLHERREGTRHALHPELAALLSTSGSTGSAKLVRLSATNLTSNAAAIATYLDLDHDERPLTSLPLGYCYGLSVLNSHLHVGAAVVLNDASVVDRCFWDRVERHGVTSFATVPHSFELLDRIGFGRDGVPPTLRTITQAGGRLAPEVVARYAEMARRQGWRLVVMYGQTEATARMAYLPPELAESRPSAIGRPIPGGELRVEPVPGAPDGTGELVYRGPNVMLGYATTPSDLARGREVHELRTGDLGRVGHDGLFEITGRASRFVKLFGLRIDLDMVERLLADHGYDALCAGTDDGLRVAVVDPADPEEVQGTVASAVGVPRGLIGVTVVDELPRLTSGKPDHQAVTRLVPDTADGTDRPAADATEADPSTTTVDDLYREALRVDEVRDDDTFVSLGGDSLSYIEVSYELERLLGHLPDGWHQWTVADLRALAAGPRRSSRIPTVDTTVLMRAVAIVAVVAGHARLTTWQWGGHLLLGVAGYNTARFVLDGFQRSGRLRRGAATIGRVAVPTVIYLAVLSVFVSGIHLSTIALASSYLQSGSWRYRLWFVEAFAQIMAVVLLLFCVPAFRRLERRAPFGVAFGAALLGLALREIHLSHDGYEVLRAHAVLWIFAVGWAAERADTAAKRALVSIVAVGALAGWYDGGVRELAVTAGLLVLVWAPALPWPPRLRRPVVVLASASLAIYLVHWVVLDLLTDRLPPALVVTVAVVGGVLAWRAVEAARSALRPADRRPHEERAAEPTVVA